MEINNIFTLDGNKTNIIGNKNLLYDVDDIIQIRTRFRINVLKIGRFAEITV